MNFDALKYIEEQIATVQERRSTVEYAEIQAYSSLAIAQQLKRLANQGDPNIFEVHDGFGNVVAVHGDSPEPVSYSEISGVLFRAHEQHGAFNAVVLAQKLMEEYEIVRK